MNVPGAIHVGNIVGIGLYCNCEVSAFKISNCFVQAEINCAVTPGAVAGRAEGSVIECCETEVTLDGELLTDQIGQTTMCESGDQFEKAA